MGMIRWLVPVLFIAVAIIVGLVISAAVVAGIVIAIIFIVKSTKKKKAIESEVVIEADASEKAVETVAEEATETVIE